MNNELMITIPQKEYSWLIRMSERLALLEQITREENYISINDCRRIIGAESVPDKGAEKSFSEMFGDVPGMEEMLENSELIEVE